MPKGMRVQVPPRAILYDRKLWREFRRNKPRRIKGVRDKIFGLGKGTLKIRNFTEYSLGKAMGRSDSITIREVESSDLETFYEHQRDPEAIRMAAFVGKDPKDKVAFDAHWDKILNSRQNTTRTIVAEGQVAGHIACYPA